MTPEAARVDLCAEDVDWTGQSGEQEGRERPEIPDTGFSTSARELAVTYANWHPPDPLVPGVLPADGVTMLHGQPREGKSWTALELALCVASGWPVFGDARFQPAAAVPVLWLSEEDAEHRLQERIRLLTAGHGQPVPPEHFYVAARVGVDLDDEPWQAKVIAEIRRRGARLLVCDPIRALSGCVDQGPRELRPLALYLRRVMQETGAAVLLVHHNSKPLPNTVDTRRAPQRASGGGVFSVSDHPVAVEKRSGVITLRPTAWKFSDDPPAVSVRLEVTPVAARLIVDAVSSPDSEDAELDRLIVAYVEMAATAPSGTAIAKQINRRKDDTLARLNALERDGRLSATLHGRSKRWRMVPVHGSHLIGGEPWEPYPTRTVPEPREPCGTTGTIPTDARHPGTPSPLYGPNSAVAR